MEKKHKSFVFAVLKTRLAWKIVKRPSNVFIQTVKLWWICCYCRFRFVFSARKIGTRCKPFCCCCTSGSCVLFRDAFLLMMYVKCYVSYHSLPVTLKPSCRSHQQGVSTHRTCWMIFLFSPGTRLVLTSFYMYCSCLMIVRWQKSACFYLFNFLPKP